MRHPAWAWPLIIFVSGLATATLTLFDVLGPLRHLAGLWFLLVCPGMAYLHLMRFQDRQGAWPLAIALSMGIDTIVASLMLYTGTWSPKGGLLAIVGITFGGLLLRWRPTVRRSA